jgi:hypothetical protein
MRWCVARPAEARESVLEPAGKGTVFWCSAGPLTATLGG